MCKEKNDHYLFTCVISFYIHLQVEIIVDKYAIKLIFCSAWCFLFTRTTPYNCKLKHSNIANCKSSCWTHCPLFIHWWCNLIYNANIVFFDFLRRFSQIDCAGNMYLTFSPSWISQRMDKNFRPAPRARFFSVGWNSPCLLQVLYVFFIRKLFFFARTSIFLT